MNTELDLLNDEMMEEIWQDSNFKSFHKTIKCAETIKKESIRQTNKNNFQIAYCKTCGCEVKMSCLYSGTYPLCNNHRDPNNRPKYYKK